MDYSYLKELLQANNESKEYPDEADKVLEDTAKSGIVRFSWDLLKPLLRVRLQRVLDCGFEGQECKDDEGLCDHLLDRLDTFENPPFTIQRICELVMEPSRHYKKIGPYMRAMERNLLVVSTQEPDLTWMKSPRLTQLLEKPVKVANGESAALPTAKEYHPNTDTLANNTDTAPDSPSNTRHPVGATLDEGNPIMADQSEVNKQESHLYMEFESVRMSRKRERDAFEGSPTLAKDIEEPRTVLQEADSTTTVGTDQDEEAMDIDDVPAPVIAKASSVDAEIETEESVTKRLKPSSPTTCLQELAPTSKQDSSTDDQVSSLLEKSPQIQDETTGQSEPCVNIGSNGN